MRLDSVSRCYHPPQFIDEKPEAQRGKVTRLRPHGQSVAELRFTPMLPGVGVHAHNHAEKREEKFNAHGVVLGAQ